MAARTRAIRPLPLWAEVTGWLMLATALALLSPGLVVRASAESAEPAAIADGPTCSAEAEGGDRFVTRIEQQIARLQAELASRPVDPDRADVVPLNTHGYSYPPAPAPAAPPARAGDSR